MSCESFFVRGPSALPVCPPRTRELTASYPFFFLLVNKVFNTTATLKRVARLPPGTAKERAVRLLLHDHDFFVDCGPHSVEWEAVSAEEEVRMAAAALKADAQRMHPLPAAVRAAREVWVEGVEGVEAAAKGSEVDVADGRADANTTAAAKAAVSVSRTYRVTDIVHTLPAGIWDSRVVSTYEMTNLEDGMFVRVRSPMSVVMDMTWSVKAVTVDEVEDEVEAGAKAGAEAGAEAGAVALELHDEVVIYCSRLLIGTVKSLCEGGWQEIHRRMMARLDEGEEGGGGREKGRKGGKVRGEGDDSTDKAGKDADKA